MALSGLKKETGKDYRSFEIQNASQREQAYRRFARDGNSPVVAIGFASAEALTKVAKEFPDTKVCNYRHGSGPAQCAFHCIQ